MRERKRGRECERKKDQTNEQTNKWNLLIRNLGSNFDNAIVCCLFIHHVMGFVVPLSDLVHDNEHWINENRKVTNHRALFSSLSLGTIRTESVALSTAAIKWNKSKILSVKWEKVEWARFACTMALNFQRALLIHMRSKQLYAFHAK